MRLNEKILIAFTVFFIISVSLILILGSSLYLDSARKLDEQEARAHLDNAVVALKSQENEVIRTLNDWAPWDETYAFAGDPSDTTYVERNINAEILKNIGIDTILLTDEHGDPVWGMIYDVRTGTSLPVPDTMLRSVRVINDHMQGSRALETRAGVIIIDGAPMVIGTAPILHTNLSGPAAGRLLMGYHLGDERIREIAAVSSPTLFLAPFSSSRIPAPVQEQVRSDSRAGYPVYTDDETAISGYAPVPDYKGEPALVFGIRQERAYYIQAKAALFTGIVIVLLIGSIFGGIVIFLVDHFILSRLRILRDSADRIRTGDSLSDKVVVGGDDELTEVATAFNQMLRRIGNAQSNLEASEARFRDLADLLPQVIFEMGSDGNLTYLNRYGTEIFGLSEDEILRGKNAFSFIVPGDRERAAENLRQIAANRRRPGDIYSLMTGTGKVMTAIIYASPIYRSSSPAGFRGSVIDVTELKNTEAALKASEEKYRNLAENTADILFSCDASGVLTYVSPQVSRFGYTPPEIEGKPFFPLVHPDDRDRIRETFSQEMARGEVISLTFRLRGRNGMYFWVEEKSTVIRNGGGAPAGLQGVIRDVTDRRRADDAIRLANRKLNLLNDITRHDIINTLTGLLGSIDMAQDPALEQERDTILADIRDLARKIRYQIEFTREYQAVGVKEPLWQDVSAIISRAADQTPAGSVTITNDISAIEIYADPLLEKVFYNLIQNAVSYGTTIALIRFTEQISDRGFAIVCEDDGAGIPAAMKEQIFERGIGRNTGMGLFLAREILGITGITIRENGVLGKGARFEIIVPRGGYRFTGRP